MSGTLRAGLFVLLSMASGAMPAVASSATPGQAIEPGVERFTAEKVFDLEFAADPRLSPDGETLVYVRRSVDIEQDRIGGSLWMVDVDSGRQWPLLDGDSRGSSPRWSPDGSRIAFLASRDGGKPDLKVHLVGADRTYSLARLQEQPGAPVWSPDGERLAFSMLVPDEPQQLVELPAKPEGAEWAPEIEVYDDLMFRFDGAGYLTPGDEQLFVVPIEGGTPRQVTDFPGGLDQPDWLDADTLVAVGNPHPERDLQPALSQLVRVPVDGAEPETLTGRDGAAFSPTVAPGGDAIAYLFRPDREQTHQLTELRITDPEGTLTERLTAGYDRSPGSIAWHPDGEALLALVEDRGSVRLVRIDTDGNVRTRTERVGGEGVGRPYASGSFSVADDGTVAFTDSEADRPADVAVLPPRSDRPRILTRLNADALEGVTMAEIRKLEVPSAAGDYTIDAWVALPPGFERDGRAPLLLEIHGGPWAMYGPFFSAEIQRYAAEGYVTVWANPRGSTGYGAEFAQEIDLAYPGEDYADLMSVVDRLVADGYASEDRLFVTGGSGGGVLTAWIVGNTDRFEAAAAIKPVINWASLTLSADLAAFAAFEWLRAFPWEDPETFFSLSPISKAGNVTTPTLLMTGEEDWRTPTWEAEQFYTALKLQGVDSVMVRVPGASHAIAARPSHLIAKTEAIMSWFERYDPQKQPADTEASP